MFRIRVRDAACGELANFGDGLQRSMTETGRAKETDREGGGVGLREGEYMHVGGKGAWKAHSNCR